MIKAMESGTGSISTTHASDAVAAIRKLVTCAMEAGPHVTQELATSKLAATDRPDRPPRPAHHDEQRQPRSVAAGSPRSSRSTPASARPATRPPTSSPPTATAPPSRPCCPTSTAHSPPYGFDLAGYLMQQEVRS